MSDQITIPLLGISNVSLFQATIVLFLAGSLAPLLFKEAKRAVLASFIPAIAGSLIAIILGALVAMSGSTIDLSLPYGPVDQLSLHFHVDGMAAFFMLIIGLVTLAVSIYSIGYSTEYFGKRSARALGLLINVFVLSMFLVTAADNVFSFLVFWEAMSLASFFLVIYEHDNEDNIKSGLTYIVMTHIGTAFILGSFLLLYFQTGSMSFESFRSPASSIPPYIKDIVFVLALVGFGTKAGLVPMHLWLPKAHPAAPSNVSALMSAVMIKIAIYGLVRVTFDFAGPSSADSAWWGLLLIAAGSASALIGVLYAAIEKDIKRALAFSSIENIGIIILGLGLSVVFLSYNLKSLASFALLASMMHSLNHAAFKSLLFMGAGSILFRTHTKNMEELGGLAKKMPLTSVLFLIGALAISGLPPLNGFVSEWLTMQALLSSYQVPNTLLQISISFASIAFALTAGIALATFVKIFGISFLSRSRSKHAERATESPKTMIAGMAVAGGMCVIFGFAPFLGISVISSAFGVDGSQFTQATSPFQSLTAPQDASATPASMSMPALGVMMASAAAAVFGFITFASAGTKTARRVYSTWDCGFGKLNERMEYTATSLSQPIRIVFKSLYSTTTSVDKQYFFESNAYLKKSIGVNSASKDVFEDYVYQPLIGAAIAFFDKVRKIQTGKVNAYLLYIMIALLLLLVLARLI
ncbi:MAG TPA: hydrogenase 4 subunit B [Nitrososphaera sp.]|nr:hydrogenase 4 subunit B [Nitrososphaera sp.]